MVRSCGTSGEVDQAMARLLARRNRAEIPTARPDEPDMAPKYTKKLRIGIVFTFPKFGRVTKIL